MRLCLLTFRGHDRWARRRWQSCLSGACCRGPVIEGGAAGTGEPGSAPADRVGSGVAGAHRACGGGGPLRTRRSSSAWARLRTRTAKRRQAASCQLPGAPSTNCNRGFERSLHGVTARQCCPRRAGRRARSRSFLPPNTAYALSEGRKRESFFSIRMFTDPN